MKWTTVVAWLVVLLAILGAALASRFNHSAADWLITVLAAAAVIVFAKLLLPQPQDPRRKPRLGRAIFGAVFMLALFAGIAVGASEFWERYTDGKRFAVLDKWAIYGDALLRFTKSGEHPPEAVVMKVAQQQIDDYYSQLRDGMCWTMDDLELADQGLRRSYGPRALLLNARRAFAFEKPEWPTVVGMTANERLTRKPELTAKYELFQKYLHVIDSTRADTSSVMSSR